MDYQRWVSSHRQ